MAPDVAPLAVIEQPASAFHGAAGLFDQGVIDYQDPALLSLRIHIQTDMVQRGAGPFAAVQETVQAALAAPVQRAAGYVHDVLLVLAVEHQPGHERLEVAELGLAEASPVFVKSAGQRHIRCSEKHWCIPRYY